VLAVPAVAQQSGEGGAPSGELHQHHESVAQLLRSIEQAHVMLFERLLAEPNASVDRMETEFFGQIMGDLSEGRGVGSVSAPNLQRVAPRAIAVFEATYGLQRQLYEIYSDAAIVDKVSAVDGAVDRYLARKDVALSPVQKSMEILDQKQGAMAFRERFPNTAGLFWAARWFQLGGSEPLMVYHRTPAEQHAGVEATRARFLEMLQNPPESFPSHMPMAPTVAPELVTRHIRAAAIFDNLNMMLDVVADVLVNTDIADKAGAIDEVIDLFADPMYLQIDHMDWIRMSLRHGIYAQGGPAIGRLDRPERNVTHDHGAGPHVVLPGM
jgi:hypothetical protein